jgi:hypothetical protein
VFNETRKAVDNTPQAQRPAAQQNFWCNVVPEVVVNATRFCVKSCFDDTNNFFLLADQRTWCGELDNGTSLEYYLQLHNCTLNTCDKVVATGMAQNAELTPFLVEVNNSMGSADSISAILLVLVLSVSALLY